MSLNLLRGQPAAKLGRNLTKSFDSLHVSCHPQLNQARSYAMPTSKGHISPRARRRLKVGETRPAIYYKFDCKVELSDGSTYTRRSQFPRVEWRYLADQRNNPDWNPSRTNLKAVEIDATGRLAKFQNKFGAFYDTSQSNAPATKKDEVTAEKEANADADAAAAASATSSEKPNDSHVDSKGAELDYMDLMEEAFVPVQSGGKLASKQRRKK